METLKRLSNIASSTLTGSKSLILNSDLQAMVSKSFELYIPLLQRIIKMPCKVQIKNV